MVPQSLRTYTPCCHDHSRTPDKINILIINWKRWLYEHVLKIGCMRMKFCRQTTEDTLKCDIIIIIINNQPIDKVPRPVGYNTMKKGLSSDTSQSRFRFSMYVRKVWILWEKEKGMLQKHT